MFDAQNHKQIRGSLATMKKSLLSLSLFISLSLPLSLSLSFSFFLFHPPPPVSVSLCPPPSWSALFKLHLSVYLISPTLSQHIYQSILYLPHFLNIFIYLPV